MKDFISNWIKTNIERKKYLEYDDLHIDEIKEKYCNEENWIEEGINCLRISKKIISKNYYNFNIVLVFHLYSDVNYIGIKFKNFDELIKEFDVTPPSLYIFEKGKEIWHDSEYEIKKTNIFKNYDSNIDDYYLEFKSENDLEFRRSLWINYNL